MKNFLTSLILMVSIGFLFAVQAQDTGRITGRLIEAGTVNGVGKADLRTRGNKGEIHIKTDSSGQFELRRLYLDRIYKLRFFAPGYHMRRYDIYLTQIELHVVVEIEPFLQLSKEPAFDIGDSSLVDARRMPQHTEFLNGTYNFPAKHRDQWEVGIKTGIFIISGDVSAQLPTPGFGVHVRRAFGYVFSIRLKYMHGIGKGLAFTESVNFGKNPAWNRYNAPGRPIVNPGRPASEIVYYNYKANVQDLALEGLITLNNIRFDKAKTGFNVYGIIGFGGTVFETNINALNGGTPYVFDNINGGVFKNRKETWDELKDLLDDSYETPAENEGDRYPKLFGKTFKPSGHIGAGIAFKLSKKVNLAIEDRFSIVKNDLLDGQRWQEQVPGDAVLTPDYDSYNFFSVGLNFNIGSYSVEPLYWRNPLDYAYSEIRNPSLMRLPKPVLPDTDGDGVTDQFDLEQTPEGCPVNIYGVSRDTDGDGIPDCRDKEILTPTYCQPVDADGVGICPCPDDCL